jgi:hypothetical protein
MELSFAFASNRVNKRQVEITNGSFYYKSQTLEIYLHRELGLPPAPHLETMADGNVWQAFKWELIIQRLGPRRFLRPRI